MHGPELGAIGPLPRSQILHRVRERGSPILTSRGHRKQLRRLINHHHITVEVKHIGTTGVWLEDIANPTGGFSAADYQSLSDQLDSPIYDTDVAEFGEPTDVDLNGKIGIVVTHEVNKASASTLGFVFGGDLVSVASCAGSNEAELFYGKAPDPTDLADGGVYTLADALADAPSLIAHEFVHIIQSGVRITAGSPPSFHSGRPKGRRRWARR